MHFSSISMPASIVSGKNSGLWIVVTVEIGTWEGNEVKRCFGACWKPLAQQHRDTSMSDVILHSLIPDAPQAQSQPHFLSAGPPDERKELDTISAPHV